MKSIFLFLLIFIGSGVYAMDRVEKAVLIVSNTPFTESGIVEKREMDLSSIIEINKTETGIINGVPYDIYYTDGSGTFGGVEGATKVELDQDNWTVACDRVYRMT